VKLQRRKSRRVSCRGKIQKKNELLNAHPVGWTPSLLVAMYCEASLRPMWYAISKTIFKFYYFSPFRTVNLSDIPDFLEHKNIYQGHSKPLLIWIRCIKLMSRLERLLLGWVEWRKFHTHTHTNTHILVIGVYWQRQPSWFSSGYPLVLNVV